VLPEAEKMLAKETPAVHLLSATFLPVSSLGDMDVPAMVILEFILTYLLSAATSNKPPEYKLFKYLLPLIT
jgi:hypothetical protein